MNLTDRTLAGFTTAFGGQPEGVVFAPGRVNLIGEHVDYNDGLVLPMPISVGTAVAWGRTDGDSVEAVALELDGARDVFLPGEVEPHKPADWRSYLRGMTAILAERGIRPGGLKLAISGSIPRGAGLSSSASLCVALGRALTLASGAEPLSPRIMALAAQRAEHEWAGVNCGIMDQMAIAAGAPDHALLLDCRDLSTRLVSLPAGWAVVIVQSGVIRGLVDGHYNARRRECEAAAEALDVGSLRDTCLDTLEIIELPDPVGRRARHVVSEIARTRAAVAAVVAGDLAALGAALRASHASLRDDFEVSVPAVDHLVDLMNAAIGPLGGARMTGGGFGGAVVAVLERSAVPALRSALEQTYAAPDGSPLNLMIEGSGGNAAGAP